MTSRFLGLLALVTAIVTAVFAAPSASAASSNQIISGTSLGLLAIAAAPATSFTTGFQAGSTATTSGILTLTDTDPSWTLSVSNTSGVPGHMAAAALGCSGSESSLRNSLSVNVTSLLGGATSSGPVSISGAAQTVSSSTNQLLAANVFTANYSQTIESSEALLAGCVYSLTATYTLQ